MPTLEFKGKQFVHSHHLSVPFRQLEVDKGKSLSEKPNLDDNLIIHGDNLHALKALLPQHAGKVNCIYIDPPYNTGKEKWSYNDNVNSPLIKKWLGDNQPVDKDDLERHDKWLCMMWPRLHLLYELLSEDGVIFISIDDNEMHHLRLMLDEIFGEDNFLGQITVLVNPKGRGLKGSDFAKTHEYLIAYQGCEREDSIGKEKSDEKVVSEYTEFDEDGKRFRSLELRNTHKEYGKHNRQNLWYPFYVNEELDIRLKPQKGYEEVYPVWYDKSGKEVFEGCWTWEKPKAKRDLDMLLAKKVKGKMKIYRKSYPDNEDGERVKQKIKTIWTDAEFFTEKGKNDLLEVLPESTFETPKPVELVKEILSLFPSEDTLILDSFGGSGTTVQATLMLNYLDGGSRRFITVECEDYADELTAERARRVIKGVSNAENEVLKDGLGGSFTFCSLGDEMNIEGLLKADKMPDYKALAMYVFYTATGKVLDEVAKASGDYFIGETDLYRVHLIYKPEQDFMRSNDSALNSEMVERITESNLSGKKCLVFASAKFMGQKELTAKKIDFCQLPYAIHRVLGD